MLDRQVQHLWELVKQLQTEKHQLSTEAMYWKNKFMVVMGLGDASYPTQEPISERTDSSEPTVLGRHYSIMGLRAQAELKSREQRKEMEKNKT